MSAKENPRAANLGAKGLTGGPDTSFSLQDELPPIPVQHDPIHASQLNWWGKGWAARQSEVDRLTDERDRYYRAAFDPRQPVTVGPSYAERERIRAAIYGGTR